MSAETRDERAGLPSASNWRRYELCPGSHQLSKEADSLGQAAYRSSPEAARGERIHAYLAGANVELDPSEKETALLLAECAAEQVKRIFGDSQPNVMKEKRLWLKQHS